MLNYRSGDHDDRVKEAVANIAARKSERSTMKKFYKVVQINDGSKRFNTIEEAVEEAQKIFFQRNSGQRYMVIMEAVEVVEPPAPTLILKRTPVEEFELPVNDRGAGWRDEDF